MIIFLKNFLSNLKKCLMAKLANDPEMAQFCADFLAYSREMKAGVAG